MANLDNTTFWSDSPDKFDEITRNLEFKKQESVYREPGVIHAGTYNGVPHDEIKELSAQHPDITFYTQHSFEEDWYGTHYTVEHKAGKDKVIKAEPDYMVPVVDWIKDLVPCYDKLEEKLFDVFKRLDVEATSSNGDKEIDWVEAEITATVEHDGYKMQATKTRNMVDDMKVFEAYQETNWREVTEPF